MLPVTHAVLGFEAECYANPVACTGLSVMCGCVPAAPANGRGEEGSLYEAESWAAIGAFLFGPDPSKALTPHPGSGQGSKSGIKVWPYPGIPAALPKTHLYSIVQCMSCHALMTDLLQQGPPNKVSLFGTILVVGMKAAAS